MIALVQGELIKLRTTRTALGFAGAALLLVVATVLIIGLAGDPRTLDDKRGAINIATTLSFVLLLFGVVGATGEYRHRTLAPALLISPDRGRLSVARILAYAGCAAAVALLMLVVAVGLGIPLLAGTPGPALGVGDYVRAGVGGVLAAMLSAALGAGIGVLVRNQVAAVVGTLVWFFVLEPLVPVISEDAGRFTINAAASALGGAHGDHLLGFGGAAATLATWAVVLVALGVLVDRRRDVT
jgi:ABC-2 type transport system permease protein